MSFDLRFKIKPLEIRKFIVPMSGGQKMTAAASFMLTMELKSIE